MILPYALPEDITHETFLAHVKNDATFNLGYDEKNITSYVTAWDRVTKPGFSGGVMYPFEREELYKRYERYITEIYKERGIEWTPPKKES